MDSFLFYIITNTVCCKNNDARINSIEQFTSCFSCFFDKADANSFASINNKLIVNNHPKHIYRGIRIVLCCFPCYLNRTNNTLAIPAWNDRNNFHKDTSLNYRILV